MVSDSALHAVAGGLGGVVSMVATYPLVSLSTRSQVTASKEHKSTRAAALKIIKEEGIIGLYDGLSSSLVGIAITNFVFYGAFEGGRSAYLRSRKKATLSTLESMAVSAAAGIVTSTVSNPIWVVNTRQTVRTTVAGAEAGLPDPGAKKTVVKKLNVLQTVLKILHEDGPKGFFAGLGPALVLVANPVLQFSLFEQLKNRILAARTGGAPLTDWDFFWLGAISKLFATGVTYPYLTVKSRMQAGSKDHEYTSAWHGVTQVVDKEGIAGLYKGISAKLIQSVLTAAILFLAKEKCYQLTVKTLRTARIPA